MATRIDPNVLRTLREQLPHGAQKKIAADLGVSEKTVYNTMQGYAYNPDVFSAALKVVKERHQHQQQLEAMAINAVGN